MQPLTAAMPTRTAEAVLMINILAMLFQKRRKPYVPNQEGLCPTHHIVKGLICSKEKQSSLLSQALYFWELPQPVLLKKEKSKGSKQEQYLPCHYSQMCYITTQKVNAVMHNSKNYSAASPDKNTVYSNIQVDSK